MTIFSIYVLSKSGGLIYHYDHHSVKSEVERTFIYPLELKLTEVNRKLTVSFGQKDGINVGHVLLSVNSTVLNGPQFEDGTSIQEYLENPRNFPVTLKFGKQKLTTNEKIFLASMFYPLFAIATQLSPEMKSSGIEVLEAESFKLYCYQTLTGIKFLVVAEPKQSNVEMMLKKLYELYSDYALKNPFYSLEMPIRCELFEMGVQTMLEQIEKIGIS